MMAYFFSEAPVLKQMVTRPAVSSGLEGCSQLMAASFDHESVDLTADDAVVEEEEEDEEIEFFEPFGQMNEAVREALLKLAREERAEQIATEAGSQERADVNLT